MTMAMAKRLFLTAALNSGNYGPYSDSIILACGLMTGNDH